MTHTPPTRAQAYLAEWRIHRNKTQHEVAEVLDVSHTTVGRWESGAIAMREADLRRLAQVLETTRAHLDFPVSEAVFVDRMIELEDVIRAMDDGTFDDFMRVAKRFQNR